MKKLTILLPDKVSVDFGELLTKLNEIAVELHFENVVDTAKPIKGTTSAPKHRNPTLSTYGAVMQHFRPEVMFTMEAAQRWLLAAGFSANSTSPATSALVKARYLERLPDKKFKFLKPMANVSRGLDDPSTGP